MLDSLSIVPGSEIIFDTNGIIINDSIYTMDYPKALLLSSKKLMSKHSEIAMKYRVFPVNFSEPMYTRDKKETIIVGPVLQKANTSIDSYENILSDNQLNKRGSISRGITVGNNQDAVINSNLNLQISGKISNDLHILAAISDENIPIQPDGNSQQIQDFDKVFIQLYNEKTKLIAGDFEILKPIGIFMNVNKKAQGGLLNTKFKGKKNNSNQFETVISGAVSKGKYCRKTLQGQEGNQGPYKINGCENEQFIIILAGSETIYINGKLQNRGKEHDYVIDYNTGEITFTANCPITKDSRIVIEFEYSERSYARFIIYTANEFKTKKGSFWLNIYSEQDSKNQPINQDLTPDQKQLLAESGYSISDAFIENADSVEFRSDYVLYAKNDTLVNGNTYNIYEYSMNPDLAAYQVGFSYVGQNNGNYIQIQNSANGRVFEWIAPISGTPQGDFEPVRLLIAPKKQQMVNLGGKIDVNPTTKTGFEFALSNYDINTFSSRDGNDNVGYAIKVNLLKNILNSDTTKNSLKTNFRYQLINRNFTAIERFRSIEFERDWNLDKPIDEDEHSALFGLSFKRKKIIYSNYNFSILTGTADYTGYRHQLTGLVQRSGYEIILNSSLLNTDSEVNNTQFIRYLAGISKSISKIKLGIENELEQNEWKSNQTDSLLNNSFSFSSYRFYIENADSTINQYSLSYKIRNDFLPSENDLKKSTRAEDFQLGFSLLKNPSSILKTIVNYRRLEVQDTSIIQQQEENTLTGRLDYNFKLWKGAITSSTFYEAGAGLEPKREYSFLRVSTGQGIYNWEDYNSNGIAELDEFEIAQFQDQANYIRIYSPSNVYIKTYKNEFSQVFNIQPHTIWRLDKGLKKFLSKFSNNLAYQVNQKSTDEFLKQSLNPFNSYNESTLINISQSFRNTFSFNRINSKFGVDYIYQNNASKILLSNGFDQRNKINHGLKIRWKFISDFTFQNYIELGKKNYESQFFSIKNYELDNLSNETKIQYQPGFQTKIELNYTFTKKNNSLANEKSNSHNIGTEINYSVSKKGNLLAKGNYLNISYNSDVNTSIAYEMLEGLKPGNNATWNLTFQRKLTGYLEMNILYNGRVSEKTKTIHTGSLQLRAFF
ncbi:MAG: hypothetical protein C0597_16615 [Marinilabiliales bacterium]|nr:MAG: hypothetical protein C0597_16615 [Marinilabiliales bacterium]